MPKRKAKPKRKQSPAQLANLTHKGAPRQRHGEAKSVSVQARRVTPTDKARFMAALEAVGLSSLLGLIEGVADGAVSIVGRLPSKVGAKKVLTITTCDGCPFYFPDATNGCPDKWESVVWQSSVDGAVPCLCGLTGQLCTTQQGEQEIMSQCPLGDAPEGLGATVEELWEGVS